MTLIMTTTEMDTAIPGTTTPSSSTVFVENAHLDDVPYNDEFVQLALLSLAKNLCSDMEECQTPETQSVPSTPIDVTDAFQCKLEQAADSVKHHLLYAVREEVNALRGKVSNLERKIYQLEMENTLLLREYVPPEILARLARKRSATSVQHQQIQREQSDCTNSTLTVPIDRSALIDTVQ